MITLVLGGARSGKSAVAERLALAHPGEVWYLATGTATDPDMAARIERHRRGRHPRLRTVECGPDLVGALAERADGPALVDSLGTWVAGQPDLVVDPAGLVVALAGRRGPTVVVSEEVGWGVHPPSAAGRRFRDVLGEVNQAVAAEADRAVLVVAGRTLDLGPPPGDAPAGPGTGA